MKITRKLAALLAVFLLSLSLFCTVAYAAPEDDPPGESTAETTTAPEDDFTIGTLPPGVGTVVDVFKDEDGRKFYTIQTPAGNTFYLIIDFTRLGENVYFLDAVQEKDLLALAEKANNGVGGSASTNADPNNPNSTPPPGNKTEPNTEPKDNTQNLIMFGVIVVVLIGGGAFYFIKNKKSKKSNDTRDEYEADEPDEYIPDNYDTEPDDPQPWEDDDE